MLWLMRMDKIKWCFGLKNGLEIIEPNSNLAEEYLRKSEDALESSNLVRSRDWKISAAYYSMYFSLYAVLMKLGIKCEIHSCTMEFMKRFLRDYFSEDECKLLEDSLGARIDAQYYVNRVVPDKTYNKMLAQAPQFLVKCKSIILKLDEKEIEAIRKRVGAIAK